MKRVHGPGVEMVTEEGEYERARVGIIFARRKGENIYLWVGRNDEESDNDRVAILTPSEALKVAGALVRAVKL
jgi:hypothetical protein